MGGGYTAGGIRRSTGVAARAGSRIAQRAAERAERLRGRQYGANSRALTVYVQRPSSAGITSFRRTQARNRERNSYRYNATRSATRARRRRRNHRRTTTAIRARRNNR